MIAFPAEGLQTARLMLRPPDAADGPALLDYFCTNRDHFKPWVPLREDDFFTLAAIAQRTADMRLQMAQQQGLHLLLCRREPAGGTHAIIGECGFSNIVRGPFQACHLGFGLARAAEGQGLMREALVCAIDFVFKQLQLHRIMANYRPENLRSGRLLASLHFEQEGRARSYLKIDGRWAEHTLTSLINDTLADADH